MEFVGFASGSNSPPLINSETGYWVRCLQYVLTYDRLIY